MHVDVHVDTPCRYPSGSRSLVAWLSLPSRTGAQMGYVLRTPFVLIEELFPTGSFFEKANLLSVLPLFLFCLL